MSPQIDAGKWDYLFGRVKGDSHNGPRSKQNQQQLASVGVYDNAEGRGLITQHLGGVAQDDSSIRKTWSNEHGQFQERESLFAGPGGFLVFRSSWQLMDDGTLRLTTIIPIG